MSKRLSFFFILIFVTSFFSSAQEIKIDVSGQSLNTVLIEVWEQYNVQFSFDDRLLSKYKVTDSCTYSSPEDAIKSLLQGLPLTYEKKDKVFVIYKIRKSSKPNRVKKASTFHLSGQVLESGSQEPLPYSYVIVDNHLLATDFNGGFSYTSMSDSIFNIRVSHLGYYFLDTTINAGSKLQFELIPSSIGLSEVVITGKTIEKSTQIGDQAGMMKLNNKIARFLPGYGDNSVMNLLRLQPGILASGEQTNDLIIWGSYAGHSQVLFDGFTIFGLKNFNDNISAFNPLVAKDIEVFKGGFDARFGERVGGIVNITGKNGSTHKPCLTISANNMTLNVMSELPVLSKGSLLVSFRQTYYKLYNSEDLNIFGRRKNEPDRPGKIDINVLPDYMFRDMNIKYSTRVGERDFFYLSMYGGNDNFSYNINQQVNNRKLMKNTEEKNRQNGGSLFYGKKWRNGNNTNISVSYSGLTAGFSDNFLIKNIYNNKTDYRKNQITNNNLKEITGRIDNRFSINESSILEGGIGFVYNHISLDESIFSVPGVDIKKETQRINMFLQDNISIGNKLNMKLGFRVDYPHTLNKIYIQPRLSASFRINEHWKLNTAWGLYNQFISKASTVDSMGNYRYLWTICDNEDIPVLSSEHIVAGTSYHNNNFTFSVEGYYKKTDGLTQYYNSLSYNIQDIFKGKGRSYGLDFMIKKDINSHSGWVSYSLSRSEEYFSYFRYDNYRRSPQDQRHELKFATLINLDPFYFSANYVYGSGFPLAAFAIFAEKDTRYSRFDVSFIYKFAEKKYLGEIGLSVLNLFNTENIKFANFERVPGNQTSSINIHAEAIPFTPALYLKLAF